VRQGAPDRRLPGPWRAVQEYAGPRRQVEPPGETVVLERQDDVGLELAYDLVHAVEILEAHGLDLPQVRVIGSA
jgi:hypothetical protein